MKILVETYPYPKGKLGLALEKVGRERRGKVYFEEVGYYLSGEIKDCVFILPKVVLWNGDKFFGEYQPEDIVDPAKCKPQLSDERRKFLYRFSTWIYRALAVYRNAFPDNGIIWEKRVNHAGRSGRLRESETLLDVLLSLQDFARENRDFFFFAVKNRHSGLNKINWTRTISKTAALVGRAGPVYLAPINRKRMINFDEELLVIFFSILNHMREVYGFPVQIEFGYELITGARFDAYLDDGIGMRRLLAIKYRYFSDKALKLWDLCYAFFDNDHQIRISTDYEEYLQAKDFERVFEAMIDDLIGQRKDTVPKELHDQEDGKIVDHLYLDSDLTSDDAKRKLFYIGDSKYYKQGTPVGREAYAKQFTYAKNVIQWHLNLLLEDGAAADYAGSHNLRDEVTEGYDVIPNFFISATMNRSLKFDVDDLQPTAKATKEYVSWHFKNRLFDRDTLLIAHYDVNFLFILSLYAQNNAIRKAGWKREVRDKFRVRIRELLQDNFDFYAMTPKETGKEAAFLRQDFQKTLGKVYKPFAERDGRSYYTLALDKNDSSQEKDEVKAWLAQGFLFTEPNAYKLGDDPVAALATKVSEFEASGGRMPVFGIEAEFLTLSRSDEKRTWKRRNKSSSDLWVLRAAIPAADPMDVKYVKIVGGGAKTEMFEVNCQNPGGDWALYLVI